MKPNSSGATKDIAVLADEIESAEKVMLWWSHDQIRRLPDAEVALIVKALRATPSERELGNPHRCIFRSALADICRPLLSEKDALTKCQEVILVVKELSGVVAMACEKETTDG